jgi:hypothetical protein
MRIGATVVVLAANAGAQSQTWSVTGTRLDDALGASLTQVPDVDGDGIADFLAGAPTGSPYVSAGKAKLYSGATLSLLREFDGDAVGDQFGSLVADLGDVDGDGVRDFAIAAPTRSVPNTPLGAIFVVSGTGTLLRTITSATASGQVGLAMTWVGDVDGDGVRDLVYSDFDGAAYKVFVVSGKSGATIRTHTNSSSGFGMAVGRVGDVSGDGVEDYSIGDGRHGQTRVYSGATGAQLYVVGLYRPAVQPAGDLDGDGRSDFLLTKLGSGSVRAYSGKIGKLLYDLKIAGETYFGTAASGTGDVDGDGRPDLVVSRKINWWDPHDSQTDLYWYSGASGSLITSRYSGNHDGLVKVLDATADLDGDGVFDVLAGDPDATRVFDGHNGEVDLVSGADGSRRQVVGDGAVSRLGATSAIVPDRDHDGWRDVAVAAPGGIDPTSGSVVVVLSGKDGHELSRFATSSDVGPLVGVGDVNGDGIDDLAVATNSTVELRSGADDSLLSTIVRSDGTPVGLVSAVDLDGTPLLAVTGATDPVTLTNEADVYDLTTNTIVTTWHGMTGPVAPITVAGCLGDVDGDGTVDWITKSLAFSDEGPGLSRLTVYTGGSSPRVLWSDATYGGFGATTTTRDLDGDGIDDALVVTTVDNYPSYTTSIVARSGVDGAEIYEIAPPSSDEGIGHWLVTLGDVDRDGVDDFGVFGPLVLNGRYQTAVSVYSGRTARRLVRIDDAATRDAATPAATRWHDDPRVDPDRTPDVVLGEWAFDLDRGSQRLFRLDDLMLEVEPSSPLAGSTVTASTRDGPSGNLVGLYALDLSGVPLDYFLALDVFDANGEFVVTDTVPASMQGLTFDVISYAVGFNGKLVDSELTAIDVQ